MGITRFSANLIDRYVKPGSSILELGNQTLYFGQMFGTPAKNRFQNQGYEHTSVDLNGLDGSLTLDLTKPLGLGTFDVITDFGTSEHVSDLYQCWKNKYDACKVGGIIISENPQTGNWPKHGNWYYTKKFYSKLGILTGLKILELGLIPAMGNIIDGWNVYCIMTRTMGIEFANRDDFETLDIRSE